MFQIRRFLGLQFKLMAPFVVASLVFAFGFHYWWLPTHLAHTRHDFEQGQRSLVKVLNTALTGVMLSDDIAQVHAMLEKVRGDTPQWLSIRLEDPRGRRLYPIDESDFRTSRSVIWIDEAVQHQGRALGRLNVVADPTAELMDETLRIENLERWLMGLLLVTALTIGWLQSRGVLTPLRQLANAADRLANDDFSAVLPHASGDEVGHMVRAFEVMRDKRQGAEIESQRASEVLRGSIEALNEAFVLYDPEDRLVFCNEKYRELYEDSVDLIIPGAKFEDIIRGGALRGQYADAMGRVDEWVAERMAVHRSDNTLLVQRLSSGRWLRIIERRMPDGHAVGFRIDITDLMNATAAAEDASRAKSQFLANMSHEIRTPMNAILGMLVLLQKTALTTTQRDYATKAYGAARSLLSLLNSVLDYSKIEAGKMTLDPRPFHVSRWLRDLSVISSANMGAKRVRLAFDVDAAVPKGLLGDDVKLRQVLVNLCGNAIKFTQEGQIVFRIHVAERRGSEVQLEFSVSDSGIGIAPENQARIFSGFTQAEASTTRRFGGTGLGLVISQRIVAMMGGELQLESAEGEGSIFMFRIGLPVVDAPINEEDIEDSVIGQSRVRRLEGLKVLVVEDNLNNQQVAQELLMGEGAQVVLADNGERGIAAVDAEDPPFDAVLMDLQMPVMDGYAAAKKLRTNPRWAQLPIIAITANAMNSDRQACLDAGMNDHVGKPFELAALVATLLNHVKRGAMPAQPAQVVIPIQECLDDVPAEILAEAESLGLNVAAALLRLGGNTGVYLRSLESFVNNLHTLTDQLAEQLQQGQRDEAARLMHTLKGLAGTLGVPRLSALAASAEERLKDPHWPVQTEPLLADLQAASSVTTKDLTHIAQRLRATLPTPRPAAAGGSGLMKGLAELHDLLGRSDMRALDVFEHLQHNHVGGMNGVLDPLGQAISMLDFSRAQSECDRLAKSLRE